MSAVKHYWQFNGLDGSSKVTPKTIHAAKSFIEQRFPDLLNPTNFSHSFLQSSLFELLSDRDTSVSLMAETCLRCFISEQIKQVCISLAKQFGEHYQFNCYDLYPFVLDDLITTRPSAQETGYQSMATKILKSFDPQQGASLSTWITRLVRYEPNLNSFLLEQGVYLISDWAILNDTTPARLQRIFKEFYHLSQPMIAPAVRLLEAYHKIYRQQRLANRKAGGKGKCPQPSPEQLQQIALLIELPLKENQILSQLKEIAQRLREYRIYVRGGKLKQESLDNTDIQIKVEQQQVTELNDDATEQTQYEFLSGYRQQFLSCLEQAIAQVISKWLTQKKLQDKTQQFLTALELFHCRGYSMTNIAEVIGLQRQDQVTRLIKLKDFRADIRQQMLIHLRDQVMEMAAVYTNPELLRQQEQLIEIALDEEVAKLIQQAETEASTAKNQALKSTFSQTLCRYLSEQSL